MSQSQAPLEVPPGASLVPDRANAWRGRFHRRGGGLYLPLAERNALAIAAALLWAAVSIVVSLAWIDDLGRAVTLPVAIAVVAGIAVVPGYLNAHLIVSLAFDRPPPVNGADTTLPAITVLVAAHNEEARIAETLRYASSDLRRTPSRSPAR